MIAIIVAFDQYDTLELNTIRHNKTE